VVVGLAALDPPYLFNLPIFTAGLIGLDHQTGVLIVFRRLAPIVD
jgi:hypothetical protein